MGAARQRRRRICPGPAAIGGRRAKLCRPVEHRHLAVGLGGAVQGYDVGGRGRVAADHRRRRRHRIHGDGKSRGRRAGRPRHRIGRGEAVRSVGQRRRRVAPRPARVGGRGADRRRSVEQIDRAVRRRGARQRERGVVGDPVAGGAAVRRERGNGRNCRRSGCRYIKTGCDIGIDRIRSVLRVPIAFTLISGCGKKGGKSCGRPRERPYRIQRCGLDRGSRLLSMSLPDKVLPWPLLTIAPSSPVH